MGETLNVGMCLESSVTIEIIRNDNAAINTDAMEQLDAVSAETTAISDAD